MRTSFEPEKNLTEERFLTRGGSSLCSGGFIKFTFFFLLFLLLLTAFIFALWPQLDVEVSSLLYLRPDPLTAPLSGHFLLRDVWGVPLLRNLGSAVPMGLAIGLGVLHIVSIGWRLLGKSRSWFMSFCPRTFLFLALSLGLGPGLLVNVFFKDYSHRPRPVQIESFGGPWVFKPWYDWHGGCFTNCSFISGEASFAAWTLAPALLVPHAGLRYVLIGLSSFFALFVGGLRLGVGGHFLSDVIFAILLTFLLIMGLYWKLLLHRRAPPQRERDMNASLSRPASL